MTAAAVRTGTAACDNHGPMNPDRKRKFRLVAALSAAVLLAVALVYTSFSASSDARSPAELLAATSSGSASSANTYEVYGKVVPGSIEGNPTGLDFVIADRDDPAKTLPVTYTGQIPDPFRDNREVIITAQLDDGTLVAEHDSLITKCPSKFADEAAADPEHVIIES